MSETIIWYLVFIGLVAGVTLTMRVIRRPIATARKISRLYLLLRGARSRMVETPEAKIHYYELGRPPGAARCVVFLTGLGGTGADWTGVMLQTARENHVLGIELAGQGRTYVKDNPSEYDLNLQVSLLRQLLDHKGLPKVVLVAISLGGWIACRFALTHPDRVLQMVLVNSAGLRGDLSMEDFTPRNRDAARRFVHRLVARKRWIPGFILDDFVRRLNAPQVRKVLHAIEESDFLDRRLRQVSVPVDVVWGSHDGLLPVEMAYLFQSGIPGSRLHIIADCGHVPMFERPIRLRRLLRTLLSKPRS